MSPGVRSAYPFRRHNTASAYNLNLLMVVHNFDALHKTTHNAGM
jgi:hypothetical protein